MLVQLVYRANVFGNDDGSLSVGTGGSGLERLRIDSTGRVLIGALDSVPSSTSVNSTLSSTFNKRSSNIWSFR